jgi:uncharacterized membrane protein SirB2
MDYLTIKGIHIGLAGLSIGFFVLRALWSVSESPLLQRRWAKVLPHLIDTLLLAFGVTLMILLRAWPQHTPWLAAKLTALLFYIGLGTFAIKRGATPARRALFAVLAALVFVYMVATAVSHDALFWLPGPI